MSASTVQELKDTNNILQAVFDSAPNGIAVMQTLYSEDGNVEDFAILLFNHYTLNWIGDTDYKGRRYSDVFPMVKETGILERFKQVAVTGVSANFERFYNGEGMNHWFRFTAVKQGELLVVTTEDITATKQAEADLNVAAKSSQKQQRLYEAVTNNTPDLVYVFDLNYRFTYANKALLTMWGRSWEESIGKGLRDLGYEEWHAQMHEREIDEIVATKKSIRGTVSFPHAELGKRIYDYIFAPVFNEKGEVEAVAGTTRDFTDIKQTEEAIRESEARFRFAMNAGRLGSWELDLETLTLHASELCKEIFGQPLDKPFTYETLRNTIHPEDRDVMKAAVEATIADGREYNIEYRIIRPDGSLRWVNIRGQVQYNSNGAPVAMIGVSADITQRKLAEQALAESEDNLRSMVMQSQTGICILSGTPPRAEMVNDAFLAISGKTRQAFDTQPYWEVLKEAEPFYADILENVFRTGERFSVINERVVLLRNGREEAGYFDFIYEPLKDAHGHTKKVTLFATEVTTQVTALKSLEEKEKALEGALDQLRLSKEAAELGTFDMDLINGTMHWDERCRVLFGINHQRPVSYEKDFVGGLHPDDRERITTLIDNLFIKSISDGNYDVDYRTVGQKDGTIRWVRAKGKVYFNAEDQPVRFIGSVLDITEQVLTMQKIERTVEERTKELAHANEALHRMNEELQRSNANLEEFAHAASHDLKEPIRKISFFTQQLKDQLSDHLTEKENHSLSRIENASQRMGNLIDDLLLYSHVSQRPHQTENVDLNKKVQHVLEDLELDIAEKKANIYVGNLPVVRGYTRQVQQMFQNLISNAIKYSKAGVSPRIEIQAGEFSENGKRFHLIEVKDNGIGFEHEFADKIFHMFTRLHGKNEYSGTGVGLSIVKKVVENHNGFIRAESTVGEGSVFKIYLPH